MLRAKSRREDFKNKYMFRYINIFAIVAILLAACTKTEVTYDAPSEIAFAPAAAVMTKATYEGGDFNVFAYTENGVPYFANEVFTDADNDGTYLGKSTQYWPNENKLKFAGYTGAKKDVEVGTGLSTMTITDYDQSAGGDLMWFFTEAVSAPVGTDGEITSIAPQMHHACAKITIKVEGEKKEGQAKGPCDDWLIKNVDIADLYISGDVTFEPGGVDWDTEDYTVSDSELAFEREAIIGDEPSVSTIVIPQTPTKLTVYYGGKWVNDEWKDGKSKGDIDLSLGTDTDGEPIRWQAGYHYTYTLHFKNPHKIEFSFSGVDTWSDGGTITMQ